MPMTRATCTHENQSDDFCSRCGASLSSTPLAQLLEQLRKTLQTKETHLKSLSKELNPRRWGKANALCEKWGTWVNEVEAIVIQERKDQHEEP